MRTKIELSLICAECGQPLEGAPEQSEIITSSDYMTGCKIAIKPCKRCIQRTMRQVMSNKDVMPEGRIIHVKGRGMRVQINSTHAV